MIYVIGQGGHARVLKSLLAAGVDFMSIEPEEDAPLDAELLNGIGDIGARFAIFKHYGAERFLSVTHSSAIVAPDVVVGHGAQIMAGAIIQAGARIGNNVIINTGAQVDHDSVVQDHCHIAPGAVVLGGCTIGAASFIGANAVVVEGKTCKPRSFVKAGKVFV